MNLPGVLGAARPAERGDQLHPRPAASSRGPGVGAAAPGQEPAVTRGTTAQAVTQRPRHPCLSGRPGRSAQHQTPPAGAGAGRQPKQTGYLSRPPALPAGSWAAALDSVKPAG